VGAVSLEGGGTTVQFGALVGRERNVALIKAIEKIADQVQALASGQMMEIDIRHTASLARTHA
jgi:hypothetical protein